MKNTMILDNVYLIESKQYRKGTPFTIKESKSTDSDITLTKSIRVNDKILETGTVIREGIAKVTEKAHSKKHQKIKESWYGGGADHIAKAIADMVKEKKYDAEWVDTGSALVSEMWDTLERSLGEDATIEFFWGMVRTIHEWAGKEGNALSQ